METITMSSAFLAAIILIPILMTFYKPLTSLIPSDSYGPQIKERVAQIVNEKFSSDIGIKKRKEIFEKYKTPEKCAQLLDPKVNEPIWASLKNFHRQRDLPTAVLQDSIVAVCSALSVTIDELLKLLKCKENKVYV